MLSHLNGFVMCRRDIYISGTKQSRKLKFSMQTYVTLRMFIFEYCHASVILDNVEILYLEDGNVCRPCFEKKTSQLSFFF